MEKKLIKGRQRGVMQDLMSREVETDVLGSYTGVPQDPDDLIPVQDVDDL